jgi:hypothetical protein
MKKLSTILAGALCILAAASCGNSSSQAGKTALSDMSNIPDTAFAIGNLSLVQVNSKPDYSAESATQFLMGMDCRFVEKGDGWTKVLTPEGYQGWCPTSSIVIMDRKGYGDWLVRPKYIVTSYFTILRAAPADNADCVSDAVLGDILLQGNSEQGTSDFIGVELNDGRKAFARRGDIADYSQWLETRSDSPENIVATAKSLVGFPYVWGGTSVKGVDCSGFTKTVYFLNGVILQRDASQQVKTGKPVDISKGLDSLQVGDLIFFGTEASGDKPEKISHVGLYIGGGKFIHSSRMVRLSSLLKDDPDYYDRKPLKACRIIGNEDQGLGISTIRQDLNDKLSKYTDNGK